MKTLVLCRHAKSDWPYGVSDINRPLKGRGIKDAGYLGDLLEDQGFDPDLIISSPANRAHSTSQIIAAKLGYDTADIKIVQSVYHEGKDSLLALIKQLPESVDKVMIFGHNPTMEMAVASLLQSGAGFEMPTSAMACMESWVNNWQHFDTRNLHLRWYLIPRLQRKMDS